MNRDRKSCRQQNNPKRTMKNNEGVLRPKMAAALLLVLFRKIWGWDHNPRQLNNQQRGQHRRSGNAHGAREDPEAVSFRCARNAPWAVLAGCIMPPNLFGHTMSGLRTRQAAVAGLKAVETPSTSCESCHALSALFPIAGARAANTAKKVIATVVATTKGENLNFNFS